MIRLYLGCLCKSSNSILVVDYVNKVQRMYGVTNQIKPIYERDGKLVWLINNLETYNMAKPKIGVEAS